MMNLPNDFPTFCVKKSPDRRGTLRILAFVVIFLFLIVGVGATLTVWHLIQGRNAAKPATAGVAAPKPAPAMKQFAEEIPLLPPDVTSGTGVVPDNKVQLFFLVDGYRLQPQVIELSRKMTAQEKLKFALEELFRGPSAANMKSAIPEGVQLRAAFVKEGGTAVIDVSSAILKPLGGVTAETLCVAAIADTVASSVGGVSGVSILVEGNSPAVLWDAVDLTVPLSPDFSMVKK